MVAHLLILSILVPAVAAGAVAAAALLLPERSWLRRAMALPALAAGYAAGHLAVAGAPSLPPVDTTQGLLYLALGAAALGLAEARLGAIRSGLVARVAAIGLTFGLALHPLVRNQWTAGQSVFRIAILSIVALGLWWAIRATASRLPAGAAWLTWILIFAGAATLLLLARTALLAQLASMIAVALFALALVQRGRADVAATLAAALPFLVSMLFAFVLNGFFYAELGAASAVALAVSPLAAVAATALAGRRGPRAQAAAAVLGVAILLAPLIATAAIGYAADDRGYNDDYDE